MDDYTFSLIGYSLDRALCALVPAFVISYLIVLANNKYSTRILRLWRILLFYFVVLGSAGLIALAISPTDAEFYYTTSLSLYIYFGFLIFEKFKAAVWRRWILGIGSIIFLMALTFYPIAETSDARSMPIVCVLLAFMAELIYTFNITIRVWPGINYEGQTKAYSFAEEILLWILMGASALLIAAMAKMSPEGVGSFNAIHALLEQSVRDLSLR